MDWLSGLVEVIPGRGRLDLRDSSARPGALKGPGEVGEIPCTRLSADRRCGAKSLKPQSHDQRERVHRSGPKGEDRRSRPACWSSDYHPAPSVGMRSCIFSDYQRQVGGMVDGRLDLSRLGRWRGGSAESRRRNCKLLRSYPLSRTAERWRRSRPGDCDHLFFESDCLVRISRYSAIYKIRDTLGPTYSPPHPFSIAERAIAGERDGLAGDASPSAECHLSVASGEPRPALAGRAKRRVERRPSSGRARCRSWQGSLPQRRPSPPA
ncbi:hypothetical protein SAMN05216338_105743 [Bradyrhizobium sp. Rc2d]|nr:hypothetical protein SAMN05216338_105743 [Bradyrhizobium sp. Rc2d]